MHSLGKHLASNLVFPAQLTPSSLLLDGADMILTLSNTTKTFLSVPSISIILSFQVILLFPKYTPTLGDTISIELAAALDALMPLGTHSKKPLTQFNLHKCVNMAAEFHTRGGTQFFLSINPLLFADYGFFFAF